MTYLFEKKSNFVHKKFRTSQLNNHYGSKQRSYLKVNSAKNIE